MQQAVTEQQKMAQFAESDIPSMAILHCSNGNLSVDPSSEYKQGSTTPKQDFDSTMLLPQGHTESLNSVSVRDFYLVPNESNQSDLLDNQSTQLAHHSGSLVAEGKEVISALKDSTSSPVPSYGSPSRKSRVPVSQFKGL